MVITLQKDLNESLYSQRKGNCGKSLYLAEGWLTQTQIRFFFKTTTIQKGIGLVSK